MSEEKGRAAFEHDKLMHSIRVQQAKEMKRCMHCGGTGFVSHWVTNDLTRRFYGNVPQEYTITCPHCNGAGE